MFFCVLSANEMLGTRLIACSQLKTKITVRTLKDEHSFGAYVSADICNYEAISVAITA